MKHALMTLIGVVVYCGGAALLSWCLLLIEDGHASPVQLVALALSAVVGLVAAVVGFIYAWDGVRRV